MSTPLPISDRRDRIIAITSRSHMSIRTRIYLRKLKKKFRDLEVIKIGS